MGNGKHFQGNVPIIKQNKNLRIVPIIQRKYFNSGLGSFIFLL